MRKVFFISLILLFAAGFFGTAMAGGPDNPTREKSETYPATEFAACGFLIQGEDCMYFEAAGDSIKLVLDNYGDFQEYDSVFVEGHLNIYCETDCMQADGCLEGNTITACDFGGGIPFQGCGTLLASGDCMYFAPDIDSATWEISNHGDFQAGDYVFVAGTVFPDSAGFCGGAEAYLINYYIAEGNCDEEPFPFQCCGTLVQGAECLLYSPWCEIAIMTPNGVAEFFALDNYGDFQAGDTVMVYGLVDVDCETTCPDADACIISNTIDTCYGGNPADTIAGCGVLIQSGECILFAMENTTLKFTLGDYGVFQPGETAYVEGYLHLGEDSVCIESDGYINNWLIDSCGGVSGLPFESCGQLVQGENCVMFAADGFDTTLFVLENYGGYQAGDAVYVDGFLDIGCETICIGAFGCIWDNTIGPCDNPLDTVTLYGVLVQGTDCVLFDPPTFSIYDKYELDNYGNFQVGDSVVVSGFFDPDCVTVCTDADACILDNTIEAWETPLDTVTLYGTIVQGTDCVLFEPAFVFVYTLVELDNYGDFQVGDSVIVTGLIDADCATVCTDAEACILDNTIEAWESDPGLPFQSCGLLVMVEYCLLFAPDGFGDTMFVLENYGDFQEGDEVYVDGFLDTGCGTVCTGAMGCIWDNTIATCETPPDTVTLYGVLVQGTDCVLFDPPTFSIYDKFALDNYGNFQVGDSVVVSGFLDPDCLTVCSDADACILDNTIEAWETPLDSVTLYGMIVQGADCVLFEPFFTFAYTLVELDNYGDFGVGDSVIVTGLVDPDCITVCTGADDCILDNTIEAWETNPGTYYEAYGTLYEFGECILFEPFGSYYEEYVLENYGEFGPYDTVFVTGTMYFWCDDPCITDTGGCILDNTIDSAGFADSAMASGYSDITDVTNYPNPFNPTATISFNLTAPSRVTLTIYNILGQSVETLIDNKLLDGPQIAKWNGDKYASGIYFYRIKTEYEVITKKMSLNK